MGKRTLMLITSLWTVALLAGCGVAPTEPAPSPAVPTEVVPTAVPTPRPPLRPTIPSSVDSFADLVHIFDYDPDAPLEFAADPDGGPVHDVSFASPMGGRVPAYLVVPPGEGPFAGVVFMHGNPSSRAQFLDEALILADLGVVSILIDGPMARPDSPLIQQPEGSDLEIVRNVLVQAVIDLRRAVDVLTLQPNVDVDRIGFVGHSYGAILGGVLAGVEHRLKAVVLMTGYPTFAHSMLPEYRTEALIRAMEPLDPIHYIGHAAPAALYFQFGFYDQSIPPEMAVDYYDAASDPKTSNWYHAGHMLDDQALYDRIEWLATQLGLDTSALGKSE